MQIERVNARRERGKEKKNFIPIRKCDINSIDYYSCFVKDFSFSLSVSLPTDSNSEFFFLLHLSWWLEYTHTHFVVFNAVFVIGLLDSSALKMKVLQSMIYKTVNAFHMKVKVNAKNESEREERDGVAFGKNR